MTDELTRWLRNAVDDKEALVLDDHTVELILNLASVAAHSVTRPAAPIATFALGLAVGSGADIEETVNAISERAGTWTAVTQ